MIFLIIVIIILALLVGAAIVAKIQDEIDWSTLILSIFLLMWNVIIFIFLAIPEYQNRIIKDYTSGKYRKEVIYKMVQKDSLMVPIDSTITYKLIKDENI